MRRTRNSAVRAVALSCALLAGVPGPAAVGALGADGGPPSPTRVPSDGASAAPLPFAAAAAGIGARDWAGIVAARNAARHAVTTTDGAPSFHNPAQGWRTTFDGLGSTTVPCGPDGGGAWTWGMALERWGWGAPAIAAGRPAAMHARGARVEYAWDDTLVEWYVNDRRGLWHGFTVGSRPAAADGPFTLTLSIRGGLRPDVAAGGRDVTFRGADGAAVLTYSGLHVADARGRTLRAAWRAGPASLRLTVDDAGAVYPVTIDPVAQQAYVKASNPGGGDQFGGIVAMSGDTLVVGAPGEGSSATGVNGTQSNNAAVGAGAAYVFVRNGTAWSQQAYLKASNTAAGDNFGYSVAIDGDTIVVGAPYEDSSATGVGGTQADDGRQASGAAYVFFRSGGGWSQQAYLKASNTGADDRFGWVVAVSGGTAVVTAPFEDSGGSGINSGGGDDASDRSGAAYVFVRNGSAWSQQAFLKASNPDAVDFFGAGAAIDGDTVVVGSDGEDSASRRVGGDAANDGAEAAGAAYVFRRSGASWSQEAYLKASNADAGDIFGRTVAVSGDTIAVGAYGEDGRSAGVNRSARSNALRDAGAAYVFVREGAQWRQQAYVKASNPTAGDGFGYSVALDRHRLVVGAPGEDGAATTVDGDGRSNAAADSGAAYVFVRTGATWRQRAYLKASNGEARDQVGLAVAVSGAGSAAGANLEDGSVPGIDGNGADDGAADAGAAYVFDLRAGVAAASTLDVLLSKGRLTDASKAGKDAFAASGTFWFLENATDATFAPASESMVLRVGGAAGPFEIAVPAGDGGWKATPKKAPTKFTWRSPKGAGPKIAVVLDVKKLRISVAVKNTDFPAAAANPVLLDLKIGDDAALVSETWTTGKPGQLSRP